MSLWIVETDGEKVYILWMTSYLDHDIFSKKANYFVSSYSVKRFEKNVGMDMFRYSKNHGKLLYRDIYGSYSRVAVEEPYEELEIASVFIQDSIKSKLAIRYNDRMSRIEYMLNNIN